MVEKTLTGIILAAIFAFGLGAQSLPAFVGAQGGGATSAGGRGGVVYVVNDLSDSTHSNCGPWGAGTCSLRDCVQASGARNCVGGPQGGIVRTCGMQVHNGKLTIAGQTFPGGGLTLAPSCGGPNGLLAVMTNDVVIRYVTASPGSGSTPGPSTGINCFLEYAGSLRVYWDHVTCRWSDDKPWLANNNGPEGVQSISLGDSLFYAPNIGHPVGVSGGTISGDAKMMNDIDIFRNFNFAGHRVPLEYFTSQRYENNLNWNWGGYSVAFAGGFQGGMKADIIGNKYVAGNQTASVSPCWALPFQFQQPVSDDVNAPPQNDLVWTGNQYYLKGNIGPQMTDPNGDQTKLTSFNTGDLEAGGACPSSPAPANAFRATPLPTQLFPIIEVPVQNLDQAVLPLVGNSQGLDCSGNWQFRRDSADTAILAKYQADATAWFYADPSHPLDQQPNIAATTSVNPACQRDVDGLPITYKQANKLTVGINVANVVASNGETNLNNYFAGSASTTVPPNPPNASPDGSTCTATGLVGCPLNDGTNSFTFGPSIGDSRGNPVLMNGTGLGTPPNDDEGNMLLWCSGVMYNQTKSGTFWKFSNGRFSVNAGTAKPTCGSTPPPVVVTGVSVQCPATVTVGMAFFCTATVQPPAANQAVTWTPAMPYTPTAAGAMTVKATSVADPTKTGTSPISVTAVTPPPNCPTTGTTTVTVPVVTTVNGTTQATVSLTFTCTWNMDANGVVTTTGCH